MEKHDKRRSFLQKGLLGALSLGLVTPEALAEETEKIKCLTKEGNLVEVNVKKSWLEKGRSIDENELKNWIEVKKTKPHSHEK